jgi:hypothetical protein
MDVSSLWLLPPGTKSPNLLSAIDEHAQAKWSPRANGQALRAALEQKASFLPRAARSPIYAACARTQIDQAEGLLPITAADIFDPSLR